MKKGTTGHARVHVNAAPEVLYDMVTDVRRMGVWIKAVAETTS